MFSNFLDLVPEDATIALKIDVQGYECKVRDFFNNYPQTGFFLNQKQCLIM